MFSVKYVYERLFRVIWVNTYTIYEPPATLILPSVVVSSTKAWTSFAAFIKLYAESPLFRASGFCHLFVALSAIAHEGIADGQCSSGECGKDHSPILGFRRSTI